MKLWPILRTASILEQRLQLRQRRAGGDLLGPLGEQVVAAMPERDVAGLAAFGGEADPDQFGGDAVEAVGLGVERDEAVAAPRRSSGRAPLDDRLTVLVDRTVDLRLGPDLALGGAAGGRH